MFCRKVFNTPTRGLCSLWGPGVGTAVAHDVFPIVDAIRILWAHWCWDGQDSTAPSCWVFVVEVRSAGGESQCLALRGRSGGRHTLNRLVSSQSCSGKSIGLSRRRTLPIVRITWHFRSLSFPWLVSAAQPFVVPTFPSIPLLLSCLCVVSRPD